LSASPGAAAVAAFPSSGCCTCSAGPVMRSMAAAVRSCPQLLSCCVLPASPGAAAVAAGPSSGCC
jgi:hypothetical protein